MANLFGSNGGKPLDKNDILAITDITIEEVIIPEWGGRSVFVKGLTGAERDSYEASLIKGKGKSQTIVYANARAKLCAMSICDQNGKRLFTDGEAFKLGEKSASALQRIFSVAQRLSGLTEEDIEEMTENLEQTEAVDSGLG